MIVSRCYSLGKLCSIGRKSLLLSGTGIDLKQNIVRNCHGTFYYRKAPPYKDPVDKFTLVFCSGMWWWFLWHVLTNYSDIIGCSSTDPSKWTDEELGIPED